MGRWIFNFLSTRTSDTLARLIIFLMGLMAVCVLALAIAVPLCYYQYMELEKLESLADEGLISCQEARGLLNEDLDECKKDLRTLTEALIK